MSHSLWDSAREQEPTIRFARKETLFTVLFGTQLPKQLRFEQGTILLYALVDPRDETVRYVGVTSDRERRAAEHSLGEAGNPELRAWEKTLRSLALTPALMTLGYATWATWQMAERNWIAWFRGHQFKLYNIHRGGIWRPGNHNASQKRISGHNEAMRRAGCRRRRFRHS